MSTPKHKVDLSKFQVCSLAQPLQAMLAEDAMHCVRSLLCARFRLLQLTAASNRWKLSQKRAAVGTVLGVCLPLSPQFSHLGRVKKSCLARQVYAVEFPQAAKEIVCLLIWRKLHDRSASPVPSLAPWLEADGMERQA